MIFLIQKIQKKMYENHRAFFNLKKGVFFFIN
jgi:hypothetical protein